MSETPSGRRRNLGGTVRELLPPAALCLACAAVFSKVASYPFFLLDDGRILFDNPLVAKGLSLEGVAWAFRTLDFGYLQPIPLISHMAAVSLFGITPGPHHLVSLVIHMAATVLVYGILVDFTASRGRAFVAAALFSVHPFHAQSVAWISARTELLSGLFFLLAVRSHGRHAAGSTRKAGFVVALFLAAGLLSKPTPVALPFVLLLLDYWPLARFPRSPGSAGTVPSRAVPVARLIAEKAHLFAISAAASMMAVATYGNKGELVRASGDSMLIRMMVVVRNTATAMAKAVFPQGLEFYPLLGDTSSVFTDALLPAAIIGLAAFIALRRSSRSPHLLVGFGWFIVTLLPTSGIVQIRDHAITDRYMYLPVIGLAVALVWGAAEAGHYARVPRRWLAAAGGIAIVALSVAGRTQVGFYRSELDLWRRDLDVNPSNYAAHTRVASLLYGKGDLRGAAEHLRTVVRLRPESAVTKVRLAMVLADLGDCDEARNVMIRAAGDPVDPDSLVEMGETYRRLGMLKHAIAAFEAALRRNPADARALSGLDACNPAPSPDRSKQEPR